MKKLLFSMLLSVFTLTNTQAQERVNRDKCTFSTTSTPIDNVSGWAYNKEKGQWIEFRNMISDDTYDNYPSLKETNYHKSRSMNFKTIVFKTFIHNNETFYVLIVDEIKGRYKYPSIQEDWYEYKSLTAYVFNKAEFEKIKNYQSAKPLFSVGGSLYDYKEGESVLLDKIQTEFQNNGARRSFTFQVMKTEDGVNVRFRNPEYVSTYSSNDNFQKNYFEVSVEVFNQFLSL
jgi:hypothetical protein